MDCQEHSYHNSHVGRSQRSVSGIICRWFDRNSSWDSIWDSKIPTVTTSISLHDERNICRQNSIKNMCIPLYHWHLMVLQNRYCKYYVTKIMGTAIPLSMRLASFLLVYHTTPHATTETYPDELFIYQHIRTCLTLTQPNLAPRIEKHQQQQTQSHD